MDCSWVNVDGAMPLEELSPPTQENSSNLGPAKEMAPGTLGHQGLPPRLAFQGAQLTWLKEWTRENVACGFRGRTNRWSSARSRLQSWDLQGAKLICRPQLGQGEMKGKPSTMRQTSCQGQWTGCFLWEGEMSKAREGETKGTTFLATGVWATPPV